MIRPYLKDLINDHKPTAESNSNNSNKAEWKFQLIIKNNFISVKDFEDTCTIYSTSKPVEIFMASEKKISLIRFLIQF